MATTIKNPNFINFYRVRKIEGRELLFLKKIAEAEHIDHVREFLKKEGIGR